MISTETAGMDTEVKEREKLKQLCNTMVHRLNRMYSRRVGTILNDGSSEWDCEERSTHEHLAPGNVSEK